MNVQELIDALQNLTDENKNLPVVIYNGEELIKIFGIQLNEDSYNGVDYASVEIIPS